MQTEQKIFPFKRLCVTQITRQWRGNFSHLIIILVKFSCFINVAACVESFTKVFNSCVDCMQCHYMRNSLLGMYFLRWQDNGKHSHCYHRTVFSNTCHSCPHCRSKWLFTDAWEKMVAKYCRGITAGSMKLHLKVLLQQSHVDDIVSLRIADININ